MDIMQAIQERHAVRPYEDRPINTETIEQLERVIAECNLESGLHIQLVRDEPRAFSSRRIDYGLFTGVSNYIVMVGSKSVSLDELCGYYGERIVLEAQMMGLNTCWVGMTYKKIPDAFNVDAGEKLVVVIAVGYGKTSGTLHKMKDATTLCKSYNDAPEWFRAGVDAALLAPSGLNQQKFRFEIAGDKVRAKAGIGFYTKVDLGIAKYHFEIGSEKDRSIWA